MIEDRLSDEFVFWQTEDGKSKSWTRLPTPVCYGCAGVTDTKATPTEYQDMKYLDDRGMSAQCGGCGKIFYRQASAAKGAA